MAKQDETFIDWANPEGAELTLGDNGDSISMTVRYSSRGAACSMEMDVRIAPSDLDRLQQWIADVRRERGI